MTKFQGGQLSLLKRLPSIRGFTNVFRQEYSIVNVDQLAAFPPDSMVTPHELAEVGYIRDPASQVKILGRGDINAAIAISAQKFSASARDKIEAAGGTVTVIE